MIGGFDLGLERSGMCVKWQVEIDPFCLKVLQKHWPDVPKYGDIRQLTGDELGTVDLICGGFPCQPFSTAGMQRGADDDRYLWPEMLRLISKIRPHWVIGENVTGIVNMELDNVLFDLEREGYETQTFIIPACAVNAPHKRYRVWIIAHNNEVRCNMQRLERQGIQRQNETCNEVDTGNQDVANFAIKRLEEYAGTKLFKQSSRPALCHWWDTEPRMGRVVHGLPPAMDRLRALGNAVVPQIVEILGRAILEAERSIQCNAK